VSPLVAPSDKAVDVLLSVLAVTLPANSPAREKPMRIHRAPALIAYQVAEETRALVTATAEPTALEDVAAVRDVTESLQDATAAR
jgi:ubiquinone biosynthesis protein UbiJ